MKSRAWMMAVALVVTSGVAYAGQKNKEGPESEADETKVASVMENGATTFEGQVKTKAGKKVTMELDAAGKPVKK